MLELDALSAMVPWEMSVNYQGKTYQTRAATLGELAFFERITVAKTAAVGEIIEWVKGVFVGDVPAVENWSMQQLMAFSQNYMQHFFAWQASMKGAPVN